MKKLSLIAALALGGLMVCSTLVSAQDAPAKKSGKKGGSVEQRLDALNTQLSLTDDQKPKVKAALEDTAKKMKDLAPEDRRTKGREIMDEQKTKMKAILTPEQYTKYEAMNQHGKKGKKKAE